MEVKSKSEIQLLIRKKQEERAISFASLREKHVLNEKANTILSLSEDELMNRLQNQSLKAEDVMSAFLAKALEVTQVSNCVTEFNPKAMEWAEDLDKQGKIKGPFHGLPIALKDDHDLEGMDTTLGYAKRLYQPKDTDAVIVQVLRELGAIPFCKTNVPQSLFAFATDNLIFGKTLNPKNPSLAPGGSSGGSGAIVGGGACAFATGSDIGGSLRIPAHFNGVCTVRPTINRLSGKGVVQCLPKLIGFTGVPGIIAKTAKMTASVYSELLKDNRQNEKDKRAMPIPWNEKLFSSKTPLRIGYFTSLPFLPALGDTPEVVLNAKKAFEGLGHTVVPFQMPDDYHFITLINTLVWQDGGKMLREFFENEDFADSVKTLAETAFLPESAREDIPAEIGKTSKRLESVLRKELDAKTTIDLQEKMWERKQIIDYFLDKMGETNLDLILCPAFPFPSVKVDNAKDLLFAIVYTMIFNLVDFPAGIVPFGTESGKKIDSYDDQGDALLKLAKESIKSSAGMPICVQLVSYPFHEEVVLRAMVELESFRKRN